LRGLSQHVGSLDRTCKEAVKPSIFNLIQERLWWEIPWFVPVDLKYASIGVHRHEDNLGSN
jgi:hypothetical protein